MYDTLQTYSAILTKQLEMYRHGLTDIREGRAPLSAFPGVLDDDARLAAVVGQLVELVEQVIVQLNGYL
jgi:hypothetical protein